jgi:ribosome-associated heat shock protein Hsp15
VSGVRADKWFWAARFWKTRSQAAAALREGAVSLADRRADPATILRVGDELVARTPGGRKVLRVKALAEVRGGAEVARLLYDDLTPPEPPGLAVALRDRGAGRPTKRDRREIERWTGDGEA